MSRAVAWRRALAAPWSRLALVATVAGGAVLCVVRPPAAPNLPADYRPMEATRASTTHRRMRAADDTSALVRAVLTTSSPPSAASAARFDWPARWPRRVLGDPHVDATGLGSTLDGASARAVARAVIDAVRAALRIPAPATTPEVVPVGVGATVCVVDTGVDLTHPELRTAEGRTRVSWLWDRSSAPRSAPGPGPPRDAPGFPPEVTAGGAIWSGEEIDRALSQGDSTLPGDRHGHGTAMASLAVGREIGIAPGAALLVARAYDQTVGGFRDEDLWRAARFCVAASADPRRTVILLALGGHDGTHDAHEPLGRALASLPALVVAAAGNDGDRAVHARLWLGGDAPLTGALSRPGGSEHVAEVTLRVPSPGASDGVVPRHVALAVATEGEVALQLAGPDGSVTPWVERGGSVEALTAAGALVLAAADGDGIRMSDCPSRTPVPCGTWSGDAPSRRPTGAALTYAVVGDAAPRGLLAGLDDTASSASTAPLPAFRGGRYTLRARGRGRVDVWLAGAHLPGAFLSPALEGPHVTPHGTVRIPATAPGIVAVGAATSRGGPCPASVCAPTPPGTMIALASSRGPARDDAPKPEVVAPGTALVAALSAEVRPGEPNLFGGSSSRIEASRLGPDLFWIEGASPAAAVVAGALAGALAAASPAALEPGMTDAAGYDASAEQPPAPSPRQSGAGERTERASADGGAFADLVARCAHALGVEDLSPPLARAHDVVAAFATARRLGPAAWDGAAGAGMLDASAFARTLATPHTGPAPLDPERSRAAVTRTVLPEGAASVVVVARLHAAHDGRPVDGVRVTATLELEGGASVATAETVSCRGVAMLRLTPSDRTLPAGLPRGEHRVRVLVHDTVAGTPLGEVPVRVVPRPDSASEVPTVLGGGCSVVPGSGGRASLGSGPGSQRARRPARGVVLPAAPPLASVSLVFLVFGACALVGKRAARRRRRVCRPVAMRAAFSAPGLQRARSKTSSRARSLTSLVSAEGSRRERLRATTSTSAVPGVRSSRT